jgi:ubiquinone/menaquinone biosynthesis C-methylase UbiE
VLSSFGHEIAVLDCGGGSGTLAVPIAVRGAQVTVVDSSIDALATLERRAAEAGVADRVHAVQADVETLADVIAAASVDLVLLHGVVRSTDDRSALAAAAATVRTGGYLSVVAANPAAGVLARALSGDLVGALMDLRANSVEPTALDLAWLSDQLAEFGLSTTVSQGLAAFSATVPGSSRGGSGLAGAQHSDDLLIELDRIGASRSPYRDIASYLHVVARREG